MIVAIYTGIIAVTCLGFLVSIVVGRITLILAGLGIVAYVFGLRHGVDADHIAAIDNTTRKLLQDGERPLTVGFWFSLGHSTIVVALIVGLVIATRAIASDIPVLRNAGSIIGTLVSGSFLWIIGLYYLQNSILTWGWVFLLVPFALILRPTYSDRYNRVFIWWFVVSLIFWSANATQDLRFTIQFTPAVNFLALLALEAFVKNSQSLRMFLRRELVFLSRKSLMQAPSGYYSASG